MSWVFARFDLAKGHYVDESLLGALKKDLSGRGLEFESTRASTGPWFDIGGMCLTNRPIEKLVVDDWTFEVPSEDVALCYVSLKEKRVRTFADGTEYYKLHSWINCSVFTPKQREQALFVLQGSIERAEKRHKKFFNEWKTKMDEKKGKE